MERAKLGRWTREGILDFSWSPFETIEKLVLTPSLRDRLIQRVELFQKGEKSYHSLNLPWRTGIFFFGPSGAGKTAAGRAIARALGWYHLTIPAHQILDAHLLERALSDAVSNTQRVIVLENIDLMVRSMEPEVFFTLIDHAMERAEETFWIANTRHPEEAPKMQLLRPGRFDEAIRLEPPHRELRLELLKDLIELPPSPPPFPRSSLDQIEGVDSAIAESDQPPTNVWAELTEGLTFAHFEELRQILARMKLEKKDPSEIENALRSYVEDQQIAGDRWGGISDSTQELQERVKQMDARMLMAALDMTDVFRRLIEKVIGDASAQAKVEEGNSLE